MPLVVGINMLHVGEVILAVVLVLLVQDVKNLFATLVSCRELEAS